MKSSSIKVKMYLRPIVLGVIAGILLPIILLSMLSIIMSIQPIPQNFIYPITLFVMAVGAFVSGYFCTKITKKEGLFLGFLCGVLLFSVIAIFGIMFSNLEFNFSMLTKFLTIILSSMIGGVLGVNSKKH
ncbi:MAG: TIGR04086 family membrane protein [Oscillospiraceae bacterium]